MEESTLRFACILGHEKPKALLREAAAKNKMGHAYLFRGPDGVGKKKVALTLAAYLNCKNPRDEDACGRCPSCRKYFSGNHPDLVVIEPEGAAIKISQVRSVKHQLTFPPLEARLRAVILEDVHTMRREAANSLLKTLEEPAPGNLLILTADQTGEILPTILSRCQIIPFGPLDQKEMARELMRQINVDEPLALTLAAAAEGSLGRAKLIWQQELIPLRQELIEKLLLHRQGTAETIATVFRLSEKTADLKENITDFLALLRLWYRDLVLAAAGSTAAAVTEEQQSAIQAGLQRWELPDLYEKLHRLDTAERQLRRNCSRNLVIETLFFALI